MLDTSLNRIHELEAGTHARVDLTRYEANIGTLRRIAGVDRAFMAVLKANAYGHGAVACARAAISAGADYLAVARISEGVQLRRSGVDTPILVLGGPNPEQVAAAIDQHLTLSVGTLAALEALQSAAQTSTIRPVVHLKIDTGLHRYGAYPDLAREIAGRISADERISLEGIYGHFSSADEPESGATNEQITRGERIVEDLATLGITFRYVHLPNSAATLTGQTGPSTLARSGIATYGLAPSRNVALPDGVLPIMSIRSRVTRAFRLPMGEGVSYGLTYKAGTDEWSATVPIGYADGLPRSLSNRGWFILNGDRSPIRGRVCMDQTVVGVNSPAHEGDDVVVVDDASNGAMTLDDVAELADTINYEVASRITARVPRIYFRGGEPVGWDDPILGDSSGL